MYLDLLRHKHIENQTEEILKPSEKPIVIPRLASRVTNLCEKSILKCFGSCDNSTRLSFSQSALKKLKFFQKSFCYCNGTSLKLLLSWHFLEIIIWVVKGGHFSFICHAMNVFIPYFLMKLSLFKYFKNPGLTFPLHNSTIKHRTLKFFGEFSY